jgi:glycerate kinase
MKKIVLAFDSFKGSVGSFEIAKAAEKAIQEELPDCQIIRFPIADGGEGTTEALCSALLHQFGNNLRIGCATLMFFHHKAHDLIIGHV